MPTSWLECDRCKSQFEMAPLFFGCPICAAEGRRLPLEMKYQAGELTLDKAAPGLWEWKSLLPAIRSESKLSLGEGRTNLLRLKLADTCAAVYLKNETSNPTWSWKDRPNAVSVSVAHHFNYGRVVAKSTGNHGNALAAYASSGNLQSAVLCNNDTPDLQLALMAGYGAKVMRGGEQDALLRDMVSEHGYFPCSILCPQAGISNPFGVEGFKTIAFEIVRELGGRAPDRVYIPVGSGDGIYGIWKGFRELREHGLIQATPKMIGCQPEGANSAFIAWRSGKYATDPLPTLSTAALSVAENATGKHALRAIYESGGSMLEISESSMFESRSALLRRGFALELASALAYAGAQQMDAESQEETWVLIASGAAVKWPESVLEGFSKPPQAGSSVRTFAQWQETQTDVFA